MNKRNLYEFIFATSTIERYEDGLAETIQFLPDNTLLREYRLGIRRKESRLMIIGRATPSIIDLLSIAGAIISGEVLVAAGGVILSESLRAGVTYHHLRSLSNLRKNTTELKISWDKSEEGRILTGEDLEELLEPEDQGDQWKRGTRYDTDEESE
ncbi:MAG: hypothetical protein WC796_06070 [Candidatus Pacearchaeota archaeon]|jgi:hypothetical protein